MKAERLWYRLSEGLLDKAPLSLLWLIASVALMTYPWLRRLAGTWPAIVWAILAGNLATLAIAGLLSRRHQRMVDLYEAALRAHDAGDLECADRLAQKADAMRWVA